MEDGSGTTRYSLRNRVHLRRLNQQPKKVDPESPNGPKVPMPKSQEGEDTGVLHLGTIPKYGPKLKVKRTQAIQELLDQTFDPSLKTGVALKELSQSKLAAKSNPLKQVAKTLLKEKTDEIAGKLDTMAGDGRMGPSSTRTATSASTTCTGC